MIELNRIRSFKTLEDMKNDLEFFIREPIIRDIYLNDYKWGQEDLEADRESAEYLLERIEARIKSLKGMKVNRPKGKRGSPRCKPSVPKEATSE